MVLPTSLSSTIRRPYHPVNNLSNVKRRRRRYLKRWPLVVAAFVVVVAFVLFNLIIFIPTTTTTTTTTTSVSNNKLRNSDQNDAPVDFKKNSINGGRQEKQFNAVVNRNNNINTINGWKRLKQQPWSYQDSDDDDSILVGKSCRWVESKDTNMISYYGGIILSYIFFASRKSYTGEWVCRDCGDVRHNGTTTTQHRQRQHQTVYSSYPTSWEDCPRLSRRGKCSSFVSQGWDEPKPRSFSTYDPTSSQPHPIRIVTSYGVGKVRKIEYEQPQCVSATGEGSLSGPCFDMSRCSTTQRSTSSSSQHDTELWPQQQELQQVLLDRLPIYAYPGRSKLDLQESFMATTTNPDDRHLASFVLVDNPDDACLLFVHADDVYAIQMDTPQTWNSGRNHYVYGITRPIDDNIHYGMAALGSVVMTNAQIRWGYDIPLPLPALWSYNNSRRNNDGHNDDENNILDDWHRPRKWLLSFKGSIQDTMQPYYQHRWLAAEYITHNGAGNDRYDDVEIDVQCKHKTLWGGLVTYADYDHPNDGQHFDSLMVNTTFAFCPGGSHVTSFRFSEVLSTGSIPVLPPEVVTPFAPEVDWSGCVIRVSQARIIDLPRRLRNITTDEVISRQSECRRLYRLFFPTTSQHHQQQQEQRLSSKNGANHATSTTRITNHQEDQHHQEDRIRHQSIGFLRTSLKVWLLRLRKQIYVNNQNNAAFG